MGKNILEYDDIKASIKYEKEMAFKEGFKEGLEIRLKEVRFNAAKRGLQLGMSVEDVAEITDLTIEEVKGLATIK
jgi:predicted transposase YdaD